MSKPVQTLFRGLRFALRDRRVQGLLSFTFTFIGMAAVFYAVVEGWAYLDALYFAVMTIATVGYGDLAPVTTAGRAFSITYVLVGLGIFVAAASALAESVLFQSDARPPAVAGTQGPMDERRRGHAPAKAGGRACADEPYPSDGETPMAAEPSVGIVRTGSPAPGGGAAALMMNGVGRGLASAAWLCRGGRACAPWARLALVAALGAGPAAAQQVPPPAVVAVPAEIVDLDETARFNGRLEAARRVALIARVAGTLEEIGFAPGDQVEAGQVLFRIDPGTHATSVAEAEGALRAAEAAHVLARLERDRKAELMERGSAAQAILDVAEAELASSAANVMRLAAVLERARITLSHTEITAPFAGRIGDTPVDVGALIGPETGPLATLIQPDPIHALFQVPTAVYRAYQDALAAGTAATVGAVVLELAHGHEFANPGDVDFVDGAVTVGTDSVRMRARFDNPGGLLLDGELVRVTLSAQRAEGTLVVPQQAVQRDVRGAFVLVVGAGEVAEQRRVEVARSARGLAVVTDGLQEGERVITEGINKVRPGDVVDAAPGLGG